MQHSKPDFLTMAINLWAVRPFAGFFMVFGRTSSAPPSEKQPFQHLLPPPVNCSFVVSQLFVTTTVMRSRQRLAKASGGYKPAARIFCLTWHAISI
jgi:hypothetical protein